MSRRLSMAPATVQVFNCHLWLVASVLNRAGLCEHRPQDRHTSLKCEPAQLLRQPHVRERHRCCPLGWDEIWNSEQNGSLFRFWNSKARAPPFVLDTQTRNILHRVESPFLKTYHKKKKVLRRKGGKWNEKTQRNEKWKLPSRSEKNLRFLLNKNKTG